MKEALNKLTIIAAVLFVLGLLPWGMGVKLRAGYLQAAGFYIWGVALLILLMIAVLLLIGWIRKHVRVE